MIVSLIMAAASEDSDTGQPRRNLRLPAGKIDGLNDKPVEMKEKGGEEKAL